MPEKDNSKKSAGSVNDRVKKVRLAMGLSQARFCRGIPLTKGHYSEIELGNRKVNQRTIKLLAASYGVSEVFLKTGEGEMFDTSPDPRMEEMNRLFSTLPAVLQNFVIRQIKELKKLNRDSQGL